MSRLIVKNLAKSVSLLPKESPAFKTLSISQISEEKLRKAFSVKGIITDVQLKYTKDGKFRHFGFVGFKNPEDAEAAKEYLDGTFLNATKIQVEVCADLGTK
jgi:RNA recognition motif-containing protein